MKKTSTTVIVICTILNIYFFLPIATSYLTHKFSLEWIEKSGQMGDTFGGLLSPIIGLISIYFIYKTFKAQREQLEDQKKQFDISRITDIIYSQIQRIDQAIENQEFTLQGGIAKIVGITGIYGLNETLKDVIDSKDLSDQIGNDVKNDNLEYYMSIVDYNLKQLIHVYSVLASSLKIVNTIVDDSNLSKQKGEELKGLLLMNLGDTITLNRSRLLWLLTDAQDMPGLDWQVKWLYKILNHIENFYNEE